MNFVDVTHSVDEKGSFSIISYLCNQITSFFYA